MPSETNYVFKYTNRQKSSSCERIDSVDNRHKNISNRERNFVKLPPISTKKEVLPNVHGGRTERHPSVKPHLLCYLAHPKAGPVAAEQRWKRALLGGKRTCAGSRAPRSVRLVLGCINANVRKSRLTFKSWPRPSRCTQVQIQTF